MNSELTKNKARSIIRALRAGVPSPLAARAITVGTANIEARIRDRLRDLVSAKARPQMLMIEGDWGFGKSHVQMICADEIKRHDLPCVYDRVNGRDSSLAHIHRSIPRWLLNIQFATARGLRAALEQEVIPADRTLDWCKKHTGALSDAIRQALAGRTEGWLEALGLQYQMPDYPYQHLKALELLISTADLLRSARLHGLVLLLDEVENVNQQYDIRGRRKSYDTLGCLKGREAVLPILFVTSRFMQQIEEDKQRGQSEEWFGWTRHAASFVQSMNDVEVLRPPSLNERLAEELVQKLGAVHNIAYGDGATSSKLTFDILRLWRSTPTRSVRLLVRLTLNELDLLKSYATEAE
jgi:hypothetical protein